MNFDRECGWGFDGSASLQAWLRTETGLNHRRGDVTGGQVDMLVCSASGKRLAVYAQIDSPIAEALTGADVVETKRALRHLASMVDDLVNDGSEGDDPLVHRNVVRLSQTLDGRWKLSGDLDPETGELLDSLCGWPRRTTPTATTSAPRPGQRRNRPTCM